MKFADKLALGLTLLLAALLTVYNIWTQDRQDPTRRPGRGSAGGRPALPGAGAGRLVGRPGRRAERPGAGRR